jgi:hypothetical protein
MIPRHLRSVESRGLCQAGADFGPKMGARRQQEYEGNDLYRDTL